MVVIQEAFGVNDHIQDVTRRFADLRIPGVRAVAVPPRGRGTASYDDFSKVLPLFEGLTDQGMLDDVDAALDHISGQGISHDTPPSWGSAWAGG